MVDHASLLGGDASGVLEDLGGVDTAADGSAGVYLLLHGVLSRDGSVLGDGGVGELLDGEALALGVESAAGAGLVHGSAAEVGVGAEALVRLGGACEVGVAGLVGDTGSLLGLGLDPLVGSSDGSAVAAADVTAVQDVLHGEVDVDALGLAGDLDAVTESGDSAVSPAGAAVLGDVLVARASAVVDAVLVAPGESLGEVGRVKSLVGCGADDVVVGDDAGGLLLFAGPDFVRATAGDGIGAGEERHRDGDGCNSGLHD